MTTSLNRKQLHQILREQRLEIMELKRKCLVLEFVARINAQTVHRMSQALHAETLGIQRNPL